MKILLGLFFGAVLIVALAGVILVVAGHCINAFANFIGGGGIDSDNSP